MKKIDINKDQYVIVEIIPNHSDYRKGIIVQLQALLINNGNIIKRMDYRVNDELVGNKDLIDMISYDKEIFQYVNNPQNIVDKFIEFIGKSPLLIIDNQYTKDYLKDIKNRKESVFQYLNLEYNDDVFDKLIKKYKLEPSNHLVDLLYESLMFEQESK